MPMETHTTLFRRNDRNLSFVMEPSKMSNAIMPSVVSAGRIEWRTPQRKLIWQTHGCPWGDHPYCHCPVLSSTALSSNATNKSGSRYCTIIASQTVHSSSFCSTASFVTDLQLRSSEASAREINAIETLTPHTLASFCCILSRNKDGLAEMISFR